MALSSRQASVLRAVVFLLCLGPFLRLVVDGIRGDLTANPIEDLTLRTGWWAITLLMVTLAITPVRRLTGWNRLVQYRRMLGLFAFFYASLHVAVYFGLDQLLSFEYIAEDILDRPYITVGFTAWLLLVPLAITSTRGWIRRLGKRWQKLHRLVYVSAALAVLHFLWLVKADTREPLIYAAVLGILLALWLYSRKKKPGQSFFQVVDRIVIVVALTGAPMGRTVPVAQLPLQPRHQREGVL